MKRGTKIAITIVTVLISVIVLAIVVQKTGIFEKTLETGKVQASSTSLSTEGTVNADDGIMTLSVNTSSWDTSKVTAYTDSAGNVAPIPKGYVASGVNGENTINGGLVIYEGTAAVTSANVAEAQKTRNQWVWIPVSNPDRLYETTNGVKKSKLYVYTASGRASYENYNLEPAIVPERDTTSTLTNGGLTGMTPDKLYQQLQSQFNETIESIKKYGGFYIGRYETGDLSKTKPVVKKLNEDIHSQTWYTMYSKVPYLAANSNVGTNMLWGCLFDETLQWLVERANKNYTYFVNYSYAWGNYNDSTFDYTKADGTTAKKEKGTSTRVPTGSSDYTKALNIYDLAGNVWEWTLEGTGTSCRVLRGGSNWDLSSNYPASSRITWVAPTGSYYNERVPCVPLYKVALSPEGDAPERFQTSFEAVN